VKEPEHDTDRERLLDIVGRFEGKLVAVLGDMVVDEFVYGDIARVSREAPVLILEHQRTDVVPGGGGNAVANLSALGASPLPVGVVGRDEAGKRLLEGFRGIGVSISGIRAVKGYETPTKSRILAGGIHTRRQQLVRVDRGSHHHALSDEVATALGTRLHRALSLAEGLLVADYGYGAATPDSVAKVMGTLRSEKKHVTVDSRSRAASFRRLTACTPNQEELEQALDLDAALPDGKPFEEAGRKLLKKTGHQAVLVTRGARGMSLFEKRRTTRHIPAFGSEEVADVTGAGDTVIAVFTLGLICGASFHEAASLANYAAGLVVMKAGTATIGRDELCGAIEEGLDR